MMYLSASIVRYRAEFGNTRGKFSCASLHFPLPAVDDIELPVGEVA